MTKQMTELKQRLVVGRKQYGRGRWDPQAKRELIETCFLPGVSVAKLALAYGINANRLRIWRAKHQRQLLTGGSRPGCVAVPTAVVPSRHGTLCVH